MHSPVRCPRCIARLLAFSLALLAGASLASAQRRPGPPPPTPRLGPPPPPPQPRPNPPPRLFGQPLDGLTDDQLADFFDGRQDFLRRETPATGLGPIFNNVSCAACHDAGGPGGAGRITTTRFGLTASGVFDPLESLGGSLLQDRALRGVPRETIPAAANTVALRATTPLFGAGLIEAIPDDAIVQYSLQPKPAGIAGHVATVPDLTTGQPRVGRFGWKAQFATLLDFAADAYHNEMGLTNRLFPVENAPNGNSAAIASFLKTAVDDLPDPADGRANIDRAALFMRYLAAPPRAPSTPASLAGERLFGAIDCAACHKPSYETAPGAIAALSAKTVALYSDLLLHDMGALGDGIAQAGAGPREMRTSPLWGLRARPAYLHAGRAPTIDAAIRAHDGEAAASRDAYTRLTSAEQQQLLAFLNTL